MIEFFALSVISAINSKLNGAIKVSIKPDVDAQNAIILEGNAGVIYWSIAADLSTNKIVVTELHFDKNYDLQLENILAYDTINNVIETLVKQISLLEGY